MRGVTAVIFRGPRVKFLLWFFFVYDFDSYPSDRELSYDFAWTLVMLIDMGTVPLSPDMDAWSIDMGTVR